MLETGTALMAADAEARPVALIDDDVRELARASKSANTLNAYRKSWKGFTAFCTAKVVTSLPAMPETVAAFLAARMKAGSKASTLAVTLAAIRHYHKTAGVPNPTEHEAVKMTS